MALATAEDVLKAEDSHTRRSKFPAEYTPLVEKLPDNLMVSLSQRISDYTGVTFLKTLRDQVGLKFLISMFCGQTLCRGLSQGLAVKVLPYMYASRHVPGDKVTLYNAINQIPFMLKIAIGYVSDRYTLFGYHRAPLMIGATMIGVTSYALAGSLPEEALSGVALMMLITLANLEHSVNDISIEAEESIRIRANPKIGPNIAMFWSLSLMLGTPVGGALYGVLSQLGSKAPYISMGICAILSSFILIPTLLNFHGESEASGGISPQTKLEINKVELLLLIPLVSGVAIGQGFLRLLIDGAITRFALQVAVYASLLGFYMVFVRPEVALPIVFLCIQTACYVSPNSAAFYFQTDSPLQFPQGPNFDAFFYNTVLSTIGLIFLVVGMAIYYRCMTTWKYWALMILSPALGAGHHLISAAWYARLNLGWGISDTAMAVMIDVTENLVRPLALIPLWLILANSCPRELEAFVFGQVASLENMAAGLSMDLMASILQASGIRPNGSYFETHEFANLWKVSLSCVGISFIPVVLLPLMIPNIPTTQHLIQKDGKENSLTAGSLYERWQGKEPCRKSEEASPDSGFAPVQETSRGP